MNKISIALCTYNGAKFLQQQLESILDQTRLPDELVVGDDCSRDETPDIVKNFAARAPFPVHLQTNPQNLGSTKNFEQTILRCSGDIIFLSDQDDIWLPLKIEKTASILEEKKEVGFVFTDAALVDENLEPLDINLWEISFTKEEQTAALAGQMLEVLLHRNVVTGATMAFRRKFCQSLLPLPVHVPNVIHDAWIALVIAAQAEAEFINEPLIKYRQHSGQQLGIDWRQAREQSENDEDRTVAYTKSINFYRTELKRLLTLLEVLSKTTVFFPHRLIIDATLKETLKETEEIVAHYEARVGLPASRVQRAAPIFNEVLSGRYHRFSRGWASAAKDLFGDL